MTKCRGRLRASMLDRRTTREGRQRGRPRQQERGMRKSPDTGRFAIVAAVLSSAMVMVLPAGSPLARGDGWQPLPSYAFDWACGAQTVHVSATSKEYAVETALPDGTIQLHITGSLKTVYSTDEGKSVLVNQSGPGNLFLLPNGDQHFVVQGLNSFTLTPEQAATLGVPQIQVSAGPADFTLHADGTASGHMGNIIMDVCAELI